jgi:hypothetical protein
VERLTTSWAAFKSSRLTDVKCTIGAGDPKHAKELKQKVIHDVKEAGTNCSGLSNCAATCWGTGLRCLRVALTGDQGDYQDTCIKQKFTTIRARHIWKIGIWLTEEATPGTSPAPRPLRPFTCHIGKGDRLENFRPKLLQSR